MSLEQQIHQPKFRNAGQKALLNILYTYGWLLEKIKSILQEEDITHQQYNILRILRGAGEPLSTAQIRERMLDRMSDTSRIVDRLVTKSLVRKCTCPHDKRLVDVTISDEGQKLLKKLDAHTARMDGIMDGLTDEEAEHLSSLLDKLRGQD